MDLVLKNLVGIYCYVYLGDVKFSQSAQEHAQTEEYTPPLRQGQPAIKPK